MTLTERLADCTDRELIQRACHQHERAAYGELLRRYTWLAGRCRRAGMSASEAVELVNRKLDDCVLSSAVTNGADLRPVLRRAVHNAIIDWARHRQRRPSESLEALDVDLDRVEELAVGSAEADYLDTNVLLACRDLASRLTPDEWSVFYALYSGWRTSEVATLLGRNEKWVDNRYQRAKRKLREAFQDRESR